MAYIFHTDTDPAKMDAFVMSSDQNTLFQCSKWASIKDNWDHCFYSVSEDGKIVASAMALIRSMPLGRTLMYIPRGPVMDYDNDELVTFMFDHIKKEAKKHKAIVNFSVNLKNFQIFTNIPSSPFLCSASYYFTIKKFKTQ